MVELMHAAGQCTGSVHGISAWDHSWDTDKQMHYMHICLARKNKESHEGREGEHC